MGYKLFYFLLGCTPKDRHIEQHDVFFAIGQKVSDLVPALKSFWPGSKLHIDCWREVTNIDGYTVNIVLKDETIEVDSNLSVFFINLGGYKKEVFNEFHSFELLVAQNQAQAIKQAKKTVFFSKYNLKGAVSHIDEKYGVDVDDIYNINDILSPNDKSKYKVIVSDTIATQADELHLGYTTLSKLKKFTS